MFGREGRNAAGMTLSGQFHSIPEAKVRKQRFRNSLVNITIYLIYQGLMLLKTMMLFFPDEACEWENELK